MYPSFTTTLTPFSPLHTKIHLDSGKAKVHGPENLNQVNHCLRLSMKQKDLEGQSNFPDSPKCVLNPGTGGKGGRDPGSVINGKTAALRSSPGPQARELSFRPSRRCSTLPWTNEFEYEFGEDAIQSLARVFSFHLLSTCYVPATRWVSGIWKLIRHGP